MNYSKVFTLWFPHLLVAAIGLVFLSETPILRGDTLDFSKEVRPILVEYCFRCHGPDASKRQADLRLDRSDGATDWDAVFKRVVSTDPEEVMPPADSGKKLEPGEIATLRKWIADGARYQTHWAFEPVREYVPPKTADPKLTEIDRFIVAALDSRGLGLSPPVSRTQLIRRATFDLTGLPPKWSDVQAFINDPSPTAFATVVDRLLDSPAYGERWGRHWLDLARYADTHGGSAIGFTRFPFSYTYRDYVIAAFNADLPYDRFILQQLAADQLKLGENDPAFAALGFLTVGRQYRNRHDRLDDQIDVITRGLLGLTVSCARCHDHKFDPIPTTDYYSLHATLASSRAPRELPLVGNPTVSDEYRDELERRKRLRDDIVREQGQVTRARLRMQVGMYLRELAKGTPEQDTSTTFLSYRTEDVRPVVLERWRKYLQARDENDPVFGPWHRLSKLHGKDFANRCQAIVQAMVKENGDPKEFADEHRLATKPPAWNPLVLDALADAKPKSFVEVADLYGHVFVEAQRRWMASLLDAAMEGSPGGGVVPDQHVKHRVINSSIERQLRHHLYSSDSPTALNFDDDSDLKMLNRGVRDSVRGTLGAIDKLNLATNAPPRAMAVREVKDETRESFVFRRGNPVNRGERVEARFLSILSGENARPFADGRRRLGLARAIVDPANPITRRVIVNWVWLHHFGRGLVRTPDDFGTRGDAPTHPELLDYLAGKLLEDGWSLKQLHRRLMLSAVYRQASLENPAYREKDPDNTLLWRMPTHKLKMEAMRDALLAVSGELKLDLRGGQPFEEKGNRAVPRRSVYAFVNRDVISPLASTFDGANPSSCTVKRLETMVPQQTLYALNSEYVQHRADALIQLPEIQKAESDKDRVRLLYQRVYSRTPDAGEIQLALSFLAEAKYAKAAWSHFAHVLLAANEFHFID